MVYLRIIFVYNVAYKNLRTDFQKIFRSKIDKHECSNNDILSPFRPNQKTMKMPTDIPYYLRRGREHFQFKCVRVTLLSVSSSHFL